MNNHMGNASGDPNYLYFQKTGDVLKPVALFVCTITTVTVLLIDGSVPALVVLIGVAAALGSYWWMVSAEARQPSMSLRAVVVAIAVIFAAALTAAPRETGDIWSYATYGRMVAVHHASPYRHVPDEYEHDPILPLVSPVWQHTGSVYGPVFTAFYAAVAPLAGDSAVRTRFLYQATAVLAVAGALVLLWRRTRSPAAIAWLGLQPVVGLQLVNGGRNDAMIGLGILAAILLTERRRPRSTGLVTGVTAAVKATALLGGVGLAIWTWVDRSMARSAMEAISEDEDAAAAAGVNVTAEKLKITVLSALMTALAGAIYCQYQMFISPDTVSGISVSLQMVFAVVVGGIYVALGPTVGAVITIMLAESLRIFFGTKAVGWDNLIYGLLFNRWYGTFVRWWKTFLFS